MPARPDGSWTDLEGLRTALAAADDARDVIGFEGCPCFTLTAPGFRAEGHCWRTWYTPQAPSMAGHCEHTYAGLHYWGEQALGERLAALLTAMDWGGSWPLTREGEVSPPRPTCARPSGTDSRPAAGRRSRNGPP